MINIDVLTLGIESTIHHLFLVLYSYDMYKEALIVEVELKTKYLILKDPVDKIGFKGIDVSSIVVKAFKDYNSGRYIDMLMYYDPTDTLSFIDNIDRAVVILEHYTD